MEIMSTFWHENYKALVVLMVVIFLFVSLFGITKSYASRQETIDILGDNYYTYSQAQFDSNLDKYQPNAYVYNFYADWCTSCSGIDETLIDLMSELGTRENVFAYRIHFADDSETSEGVELARQYGVISNSTVLVVNSEGREISRYYGTVDREQIGNDLELAAKLNF